MSWAQDEWKNNLPHNAIQKIDAIERQNDQLRREIQQKKFLLENAEVALEQQKNKTVQEKSQNTILRKDLQILEERCRESEISKEKVLHDMQTKDNRISCLDGQLMKFKAAFEEESLKLTKLQTEHEQEILIRNKAQDLLKQKENDIEKLKQRLSSSSEDVFKQTNISQTTAVDSLISFDDPVQTTYNEKVSETSSSDAPKKVTVQSSGFNIFGDVDLNQTSNESSSNESLKKQIADLDAKFKLKQADMIKLQQQYTDTCFSLDKLKSEFNSSLSEMTKANDEVVKLRANCEEKQLQNTDLQRNIKMLQQQYDCERHNSKAALKAQETRMKEQEKEMREEMSRDQQHMKNQHNDLQMQFSELQKKWNDSRHENQVLERNLNQTNQEREILKVNIEEQKQALLLIKSNHLNSLNDFKLELEKTHLKEITAFKNKLDEKTRELTTMTEGNKIQKNELLNVNKSLLEANNNRKELEETKTAMEKRVLQLSQAIEENKQNARSQLSELEKEMAKKMSDKNDHNICLSKAVEEHLIKIKELSKDLEQKKNAAEDFKCKWESSEFKFSKLSKEKCDVDKEFSIFKCCAEKKENEMAVMIEKFIASERLMKEQECKLKDITEKLNIDLLNSKKQFQDLTVSILKKDQELLNATAKLEEHGKIVFGLENKLMEQNCTMQLLLTEKASLKDDIEKKQLELAHEKGLLKDDFEKKLLELVHERDLLKDDFEKQQLELVHERDLLKDDFQKKQLELVQERDLLKDDFEKKQLELVHERNLLKDEFEKKQLDLLHERDLLKDDFEKKQSEFLIMLNQKDSDIIHLSEEHETQQKQLDNVIKSVEQLADEKRNLKCELDEALDTLSAKTTQVEEMKLKILEMQSEEQIRNEHFAKEIEEKKLRIISLESYEQECRSTWEKELKSKSDLLAENQISISDLNKKNNKLMADVDDANQKFINEQELCKEAEKQQTILKDQYEQSQQAFQNKCAELKSIEQIFQDQYGILKENLQLKTESCNDLVEQIQSMLETIKVLENTKMRLEFNNSCLEEDNELLVGEKSELSHKLEEKDLQLKETNHKYDAIFNQLNDVSFLLSSKEQEIASLKQDLTRVEQSSLSKENEFKLCIEELKTKNAEIDNELLLISKQAGLLRDENDILNKNYTILSKDFTEMSVLHTYVCNERNQLAADFKLSKDEITEAIGLMQSKESSLQQLNSDLERLRDDFQMKTKAYEDLLSERNQTKQNLENAEDQLQQVTLLFDEKVENLQSLTLEFEVKEKSMQELLINKEQTILELQSIISMLQKQLSTLEDEVMSRSEELKCSVATIVELQENLKENREELALLKESKKNVDEQAKELNSKIYCLESDIVKKDLLLTDVENQMKLNISSYEEKLLEKQAELFSAVEKAKEYQDALEKMNGKVLQISEDFNACMSEKVDAENHLVILMNKVELQESYILEKNEYIKLSEQRVEDLCSQLEDTLKSKQEQADDFSFKYNELERKNLEYLEEIKLIQKVKFDLENSFEELKQLLDSKERENKNIMANVSCLTDKIKEKESEFANLLEQHNQIKSLLDHSNSLVESLKITLCNTEQNNNDLELSFKQLEVDKNSLIDSMTQELNAKAESIVSMQNALDSMNTLYAELQSNFSKKTDAFELLSKQYDTILSEKGFVEQLLFTSTEEKTFAEGMVLTLETKCASLEREKLTVIKMNAELEKEIDEFKSELEVYKTQKEDSVNLLSKRDELVKTLYADIKSLQNDLESKIDGMMEMEQFFAKEKGEYQNMLFQLENSISAKDLEIKKLQRGKDLLKNKHEKNEGVLKFLTEENKKKDDALVNMKLKLKTKIQNQLYQIEKLNEEIKLLELKLQSHSTDLKVKSDAIQDLNIMLLASQEKNDKLENEKNSELKEKIAIIDSKDTKIMEIQLLINSKDTEIMEMQLLMNEVKNRLEHVTLKSNEMCLQLDLLNKEKVELESKYDVLRELESKYDVLINDVAHQEKINADLKKMADEEKSLFEIKMKETMEIFQLEKKQLIEEQLVMSKSLETKNEKLNHLQNEILVLNETLSCTKHELFEKNEEYIILNFKFDENLKTEKMHQESINELTTCNCALQNEKQNLIAEVGQLQKFIVENKEFMETLCKDKNDLTFQLNTMTCDRDRLCSESNNKSEEISKLYHQLNDTINQHGANTESLNQLLENYKVKEVEFLEALSTLDAKNKILETTNIKLKKTCDDLRSCLEETSVSFADLKKLLDEKDQHIKDLSKSYFSTEADLQCKLSLLLETENEKATMENSLCDVQVVMKTLSDTHNQLRHRFKKMQKKEKITFHENEKRQKLLDELTLDYKKQLEHSALLQQELQKVKDDLEGITIEKDQLFAKSKELELSKSELENELILKTDSCQRLFEIEEVLISKSSELEANKDELRKQKIALKEVEAGFHVEKQSFVTKLSTVEQENIFLEENLNNRDEMLNELQVKLNCAENNLVILEKKLQEQIKCCDNFISDCQFQQETITNLQLVLDEKTMNVSALEIKLKDVINDRSLVNTRLDELRVSYEDVKLSEQIFQNESLSLRNENEQLCEKNNSIMKDLLSAEVLVKQLTETVEHLTKDYKNCEKENANVKKTICQKEKKILHLNEELSLKEKDLEIVNQFQNELKRELEKCKHKAAEADNTIECLSTDLIKCENSIALKEQQLFERDDFISNEKKQKEDLQLQQQRMKEELDSTKFENSNTIIALEEIKKEKDGLIAELEELKTSLLEIKHDNEKLFEQVEIKSRTNVDIEKELSEYKQLYDQLNDEFNKREKRLDEYQQKNAELNASLTASTENITELCLSFKINQEKIDVLTKEKDVLLTNENNLTQQLNNIFSEIQKKDSLYDDIKKENKVLQEQIESVKRDLHAMEELSTSKDEKISCLRNRYKEKVLKYKSELKEINIQNENALNVKTQSFQCLQTEKDELTAQMSIKLKNLSELKETHLNTLKEKDILNVELEELNMSLLESKCNNKELFEKAEIMSRKNFDIEKELSEYKQLYDQLNDEFNEREKRLDEYQQKNAELNARLTASAENIIELSLSFKINQEKLDVLTKEKDVLLTNEINLTQQLDDIFSEIQRKDSLYVDIKNEKKVLQEQIESVKRELHAMEELSTSKDEKISCLRNRYKEKVLKYKSELKEINIQNENALNIKTQSFQCLQTEKDELTEQMSITLKNLSELKETHLNTLKEKDILNAEFKNLQEEFKDVKESLEYISTVNDEYKSQFQLKTEEFDKLKEKHIEEIKILNATIIAMNAKKEQTKVHLETLIEEKLALDEELRAKINEVLLLKESAERYNLEIVRLEKVYNEELDKNDLLNADICGLKTSVVEIKTMLENERKVAISMQLKLDKANQTVKTLEKDFAIISNNLLLKTKEYNEISEKLASTFLELNNEREKNISKQSKLDQIKDTLLQKRAKHGDADGDVDIDEFIDFSSLILQLQEKVAILERDQNRAIEKAVDKERNRIVEASKRFVLERENENEKKNKDLAEEIEAKNKKIENLLKKVNHQEEICKEYEFTIEKEKQAYKEVIRQCEDQMKIIPQETKPSISNVEELYELKERMNLIKEQNENLKSDLMKTVSNYEKEKSKETHKYEILKEEFNALKALCNVQDADLKKLHLITKEPVSNLKQLDILRESLSKCKEENTELMLKNDELDKKYKTMITEKDKEVLSLNKQISVSMESNECLQKQVRELLSKIAEFEKLYKASLTKVNLVSPITKSLSSLKVLSSEDEESIKSNHTPKRATQDPLADTSAKRSRLTSVKEEASEPKRKESSASLTHSRRRKSIRLATKPYAKDLSSSDEDLLNKPERFCDKENIAVNSAVSYLQSDSAFGQAPAPLSPAGNKNQNSSIVRSKKTPQEVKVLHSPATTRVTRSKSGSSLKVEPTVINNRPASVASSSDTVKKIDTRKTLKTDLGSEDEKCNMQ